jgi:hypothetical protein
MGNSFDQFLNENYPSQSLESAVRRQAAIAPKVVGDKMRNDVKAFSDAIGGKLTEFAQRYGGVDLRAVVSPLGVVVQSLIWNEVARRLFERGGEWRSYVDVDAQVFLVAPLPEPMTVFEWYFAYDAVRAVAEVVRDVSLSTRHDGTYAAEHFHWLRS